MVVLKARKIACRRGISGVVLGYSRLDGGTARAQVGQVSFFSDFIRGQTHGMF